MNNTLKKYNSHELSNTMNFDNPFFFEFFENFESINTRKSYKNDINQFLNFLKDSVFEIRELADVKRLHAVTYKKWLSDTGYAPKTINRKMSSVSSFWDYLVEKSMVQFNVFDSIKRPKQVVQKPTNDLSDQQITDIFEVADSLKSKSKFLHRSIIYMLFTTGIRKSEIIGLKREDLFKEKENWFIRIRGKGGKILIKLLPQTSYEVVSEYMGWMKKINREIDSNDWIFQPTRNPSDPTSLIKPLNPKTIDYILKSICKKAGITHRVSPHSARASYIGSALDNGADLYKVSRDVGHSSVKTTEEYNKRRRKVTDSPTHHLGFLKDSTRD